MAFNIRMGVPGMEAAWNDLLDRAGRGQLDKEEQKFYRKLVKALGYLRENPRHNSWLRTRLGSGDVLLIRSLPLTQSLPSRP
jgi:hypothetical protein